MKRPSLALLPLLALAACDVDNSAARALLQNEGLTDIVVSHVPYFDRPCPRSEPYGVRYVAKRDGRRVQGFVCAVGESAQGAVLRDEVDVEERWLRGGAW